MKIKFDIKVYYYDTDKMGVVYHANYLKWMEMARTEYFNNTEISYGDIEKMGYYLPVKSANIEYISSAKYGDEIKVFVEVKEINNIKINFYYEMYDSNDVLKIKGSTLHVFTDTSRNLKRISMDTLEKLKKFKNN